MPPPASPARAAAAVSGLLSDGPIVLPALLLCDFGHLAAEWPGSRRPVPGRFTSM